MTHTADDAAFLAAICAAPDDDTPRLVYADWMDDHGQPEWAEFIRVQCRIAGVGRASVARINDNVDWSRCTGVSAVWCPNCGDCSCADRERSLSDCGCPLHDPTSNHDCIDASVRKLDALRARELELFRGMVHAGRASFGLPAVFVTTLDAINGHLTADTRLTFPVAFVRRGFVDEIRCTLAAWSGLAGDVVRAAPTVTRVVTDREPHEDGWEWQWVSAANTADWRFDVHRESLPMELARYLTGGRHHQESRSIVAQWWGGTPGGAT